jgi:hypothetical protein
MKPERCLQNSELKFIFSRIGVCIVLRELVRLHVKIDLARGLPIIHANFVGYDEHAHRRGPGSAFAMWTLKGIDGTIKDLVRSARWSEKRDYRVFIYSDHGQEACLPYERETGRTIHQSVADVFRQGPLQRCDVTEPESAIIPHSALQQRSSGLFRRPAGQTKPAGQRRAQNTDRIHLCNTHLSIIRKERLAQMRYLANEYLADEVPAAEPVIVCGDLNASPLSPAYQLLSARLTDTHRTSATDSPGPTFLSSYPLVRLDHIFASRHLVPIRGTVVRSGESRLASDHLPVVSVFLHDPARMQPSQENGHG